MARTPREPSTAGGVDDHSSDDAASDDALVPSLHSHWRPSVAGLYPYAAPVHSCSDSGRSFASAMSRTKVASSLSAARMLSSLPPSQDVDAAL